MKLSTELKLSDKKRQTVLKSERKQVEALSKRLGYKSAEEMICSVYQSVIQKAANQLNEATSQFDDLIDSLEKKRK